MTNRQLGAFAGAGSAGLLLAALTFQWLGYAPCELCILQRWPHLAAALLGATIAVFGWRRWLAALGLLAAVLATAFAIYHAGVELKFWAGPQHCSGGVGNLASMSTQDLMTTLQNAPVVRCDEVSWSLFGLSMAGWNALCSAGLALIWLLATIGRRKA